ncbi:hypothetical protein Ga0074812_111135 [Parafrankia irregularis]|uniref:Uncharacterized protein n=1 Tax=Parafrankia irregularis TaxID=795642 RepID=A0A0S4QPD2_9ACTN|nr:hypothetical protein Ga0074812_111135 [Parafrankia irregularis]
MQEETEDAYRGRAFSLYDLLFNLAFVAAAAVAALIVPENGRSAPTIIVAGIGYCLAGLVYYRAAMRHPEDRVIRGVGAAHNLAADSPITDNPLAAGPSIGGPVVDNPAIDGPSGAGSSTMTNAASASPSTRTPLTS